MVLRCYFTRFVFLFLIKTHLIVYFFYFISLTLCVCVERPKRSNQKKKTQTKYTQLSRIYMQNLHTWLYTRRAHRSLFSITMDFYHEFAHVLMF